MDTIKSGKEDLQKAMYEVSAKLYQNAAPNQTADAAENQNNNTNTTQIKLKSLSHNFAG